MIEHLDDPLVFMREVRAAMSAGGMLMLSTPNFRAPEALRNPENYHWFSPPAHISYFTSTTLRDCEEKAGFEAVQIAGVLEGDEMPLPRGLAAALAPFHKGRRLRPGRLLGKLIKDWQHRRHDLLKWANSMEVGQKEGFRRLAIPTTKLDSIGKQQRMCNDSGAHLCRW